MSSGDYITDNKHRLPTLVEKAYRPYNPNNDKDADGVVDRGREAVDMQDGTLAVLQKTFSAHTEEEFEAIASEHNPLLAGTAAENRMWKILSSELYARTGKWNKEWLYNALKASHRESEGMYFAVGILLSLGDEDPIGVSLATGV